MIWPHNKGQFVCNISTFIFGQVPVSSLKLNVSLYLYIISMTCFFSESVRQDFSKSTYLSNISPSDRLLPTLSCSNHGYYSFVVIPVIVDIHGYRFEVFTWVSEIHQNEDLVLGIKNIFKLEGVLDLPESCFKYLSFQKNKSYSNQ